MAPLLGSITGDNNSEVSIHVRERLARCVPLLEVEG